MNFHSVKAIYKFEMQRFFRTILQSFVSPVLSASLYFIVFGDTSKAFVASFSSYEVEEIYYTSRWFYDIILAVILLPIVIKKELAELAWVSYVLFTSLTLFVLLNFILLVI